MATIDRKIDEWKNKLLDIGKRNRLINFRITKRSNLMIKKPSIYDLWKQIVIDESPLEFPYYDEDQITIFDEENEEPTNQSVVTNQSIKDQQKTLRNLRDKAKLAIQEQGINILYLSFGFLKWKEDINSDVFFLSPLILVPVTLTLESITSPFILELHEDEITVNPTLSYKLHNDFGLTLSEFDTEVDLEKYYKEIQEIVKSNKWEVVLDAGLSLFSYLKINMYNDMNKNKEKIRINPIVRAIVGDKSAIEESLSDVREYDHDREVLPTNTYQIVDADSSQQDAVQLAKKGVSFVLQGPPGTGKSQTITNIIAECLADDKKVLFVSEKMAALEVVHKRLSAAKLTDFCLTLHSHKANKKEVLEQLSKVLTISRNKANIRDEAFQKLDLLQEDKEKLNAYAHQIHVVIQPFGKSIYQVNGCLANLETYDNVVFDIPDIASIDMKMFNKYINLLTLYTNTIREMSEDYHMNPWNDANIPGVTNEIIHDIGAYLSKMLSKLRVFSGIVKDAITNLKISHVVTYIGVNEICDILDIASKSTKAPVDWITHDDITSLWDEVDIYDTLKLTYINEQVILKEISEELLKNASYLTLMDPNTLLSSEELNNQIQYLSKIISDNVCLESMKNGEYEKAKFLYEDVRAKIVKILEIRSTLLDTYEREIFTIDHKQMLQRFKIDYKSIFRIFKKQYKTDKRTIKYLLRNELKKFKDQDIITTLKRLSEIDEITYAISEQKMLLDRYFGSLFDGEKTDFDTLLKHLNTYDLITKSIEKLSYMQNLISKIESADSQLKRHFYYLYSGISTDWQSVIQSLNWARDFKTMVNKYDINSEFIEYACTSASKIRECKVYLDNINTAKINFDIEFNWYLNLFDNKEEIKSMLLDKLYNRVDSGLNKINLLEEWVDFRVARINCINAGLGDCIDKIDKDNIKSNQIIPVFKKRFYRLWLDKVLVKYPAVLDFRRRIQENTIEEFVNLDKMQFEIAKARILKKLIDNLPSFYQPTKGIDELSILKRELNKQRKIMPIRRLFREIPNLLLTLKPCLMMSPLSVSLFLEADSYKFDTVIFDEASQVCTENAIGAISRGKQVIIAGDSKQLPPTNFFNSTTTDDNFDNTDDEEEDDDINAYESILDEAGLLPERTLLWHYRSKHEELIAFSNAKIYRNNLITFPANVTRGEDKGVEYIYVSEGFYDRGGKRGNVIEAEHIVDLVFDHFKKFPGRSLGVIAFGEVQQQAIETAIRQSRKKELDYEVFFDESKEEAFFVKNLENVQGDERDTIIFSIGYAKDINGKFAMNFGPLSKGGGERRLNVAITRAKYNVKLVGSILPTDIDLERISSEGPKLLRAYIDYALNGPSILANEVKINDTLEYDSPFEEAVYKYLENRGYQLCTQVGCSGYRIDIGVKHPTISGQFVLGVECDGTTYHSARTARERDRLRQTVLEDMGWRIYRVWSTDWIKDSITEGEKLISIIEEEIMKYSDNGCYENEKKKLEEKCTFLKLDKRLYDSNENNNPFGFNEQGDISLNGIRLYKNKWLDMENIITELVNRTYPLHFELLCKALVNLYDNEKVTSRIQNEIEYDLKKVVDVVRIGDFLYPKEYPQIIPQAINNTRKVKHISIDEITEAMVAIISKSIGISKESLFNVTAHEYSFERMGEQIRTSFEYAYTKLIESGRIEEIDNKVLLVAKKQ